MHRTNRRRDRGFTLMELMVVIVILGLLAGIVAMNFDKVLGNAKRDTCKINIKQLGQVVENFRLTKGRLPDSLDELVSAELINEVPKDPWGGDFQYSKTDRKKYDIKSLGADQQEGGEGEDGDIDLAGASKPDEDPNKK